MPSPLTVLLGLASLDGLVDGDALNDRPREAGGFNQRFTLTNLQYVDKNAKSLFFLAQYLSDLSSLRKKS